MLKICNVNSVWKPEQHFNRQKTGELGLGGIRKAVLGNAFTEASLCFS